MSEQRVAYRAQVRGGTGWVDGGLFTKRALAEDEADRLAGQYERPSRVVEERLASVTCDDEQRRRAADAAEDHAAIVGWANEQQRLDDLAHEAAIAAADDEW